MENTETAIGKSNAARQLRRGLAVLLLGGTAVVALHDWLGIGAGLDFAISEALYDAVVIGAGLACLIRASDYPKEKAAWLWIGSAILCWGAAEVYWTAFIEGNASAPYPSPADLGYLAFYPSPTLAWRCWCGRGRTRSGGDSGWTA